MKSAQAFRSIGEVAALIGVAPHVLRYWETQFPMLKPMKRPDGRRYFRPADVALAAGLVAVLRDDGLTIRGARRLLDADRGEGIRARGLSRLLAAPAIQPVSDDASLWLGRLAALAHHLRHTRRHQAHWHLTRPVLLRLGQAMMRMS